VAGQCTLVCAPDRLACGAQCVDPLSDPLNCGACGIQCPAGIPCVAGFCGCTGTLLLCNGQCVDPAVDPNHCGGCNVSCGAAGFCSGGVCQCAAGETLCNGACVDLLADAANCGVCGAACLTGQVCSAGVCTTAGCPAGTTQCGTDCVDTLVNRAHCGGCNLACAEGLVCVAGACTCPTGTTLCDGTCVDTSASAAHCGACNSPCPAGATCSLGVCQCPTGTSDCAGVCVSLSDNDAHCGACNAACPPAQTCVGTTCTCPNGGTLCDQICVDTQTSNEHCGECGTTCVGGQYCANGTCQCEPPLVACGELCVDTQTSTEHCGGCFAPCAADRTCIDGLCNGIVGDGPDNCGGEAHSVTIDRISVYQAVEVDVMDAGSPIAGSERNADLVQARDAVFRVFVTLESGWTPREVSVRVQLTTAGTEHTVFTRKTLNVDSEQSDLASTIQVEADGDLIGPDTTYAVEIVECETGPGGTVASPRFPSEGATALEARPTGVLTIAFVPVQVDSWSPDTSEGALQVYRDYLQAMYPISEITTSVANSVTTSSGFDWSVVLDQVRDRRAADSPPDDVYYYGLIRPAETLRDYCRGGCTTGMGYVTDVSRWAADYRAACGVAFADEDSAVTMAHEVGHNHGREHSPCGVSGDPNYPYPEGGIGSWGYDARTGSLLDPARYADIMSYCSPVWVSDWTYQAFVERVAAVNGVTAQSLAITPTPTEQWYVLLMGPTGAHWGIPYRTAKPAFGTPASARVLAEDGSAITSVAVYATATSLPGVHSYLVPPPRAGWHSIEISGGTPVVYP